MGRGRGRQRVEEAQTLDISTAGARIQRLSRRVEVGTILGVQHGDNRYAVAIPVAVQVIRAGVTSSHTGRMNDLSESGLCASIDGDLAPGELVTVSFNLPTAARAFRIHATVRRRTCNDYGLAFVDVTPEQQLCIRNLCGVLPPLEALQDSSVMYR